MGSIHSMRIGLRALRLVMNAVASLGCVVGASAQESRKAPAKIVDLNSANAEQLTTLPGVAADTAKKIIGARPFESLDDLKALGLNDAQIDELAPYVALKRAPRPPRGQG